MIGCEASVEKDIDNIFGLVPVKIVKGVDVMNIIEKNIARCRHINALVGIVFTLLTLSWSALALRMEVNPIYNLLLIIGFICFAAGVYLTEKQTYYERLLVAYSRK